MTIHHSAMRRRDEQRRLPAPPGGFTLLEMLLVLMTILVILAVVYPSLQRQLGQHQLQDATEQVRSKLAGTRVRAIDSSVIYQFLYEPGGRWFLVIPFEQEAVDPSAAIQAVPLEYRATGRLPEGFEFRPSDPSEPMGGSLAQEILSTIPGSIELTSVRWSLPILFFPDGTASESAFEVYDNKPRRNYMELSVRSLTGAVSVSRVRQEEQRYR
jgi:prepilin-type N-terminal cleavage/methylation domain-containing protein